MNIPSHNPTSLTPLPTPTPNTFPYIPNRVLIIVSHSFAVLFGVPGSSVNNPGSDRVEIECGSLSRILNGGSILCIGNCFLLGFCALLSAFALHHLDPSPDAERHRRRRRNKTFAGITMQGWRSVIAVIATFEMLMNAWLAFMISAAVDSATNDEILGDSCTMAMQNITLRIACFSQVFAAAFVGFVHLIALLYWLFLQMFRLRPRPSPSSVCRCPWLIFSFGRFGEALSFRRLVAVDSPPASPPAPAAAIAAAAAAPNDALAAAHDGDVAVEPRAFAEVAADLAAAADDDAV
jgi:hypothetical protein